MSTEQLHVTQQLPQKMTPPMLLKVFEQAMLDNDMVVPSNPLHPYIKCNHGPGYNKYGDTDGIGEGIWVRPIVGDDKSGIGFLANTSFNYGVLGDLVQYGTYNPDCNPIIMLVVRYQGPEDARQEQFDRAIVEIAAGSDHSG